LAESNPLAGVEPDTYSPTNPLAHLTPDQIAHLTATFKKLDVNNDGYVDEGEIMGMLVATFPAADMPLLDEVRNVIFDTADRNGDGRIDLNEFLQSIASGQGVLPVEVEEVDAQVNSILSHLSTEEIDMFRDAFIKIDRNGDGFVDREELLAAVKAVVGVRFDALKLYLDQIFDVADKDADGKLNLTEFLASFAEGPGVVPHEVVMDSVQSIRVRLSDEEIAALQDSFIQIDVNRDNFIDTDELNQALKKMLKKKFPDFTDNTFADMVATAMKVADKDGDGKLNLAEFIRSYQEDQGVLPHAFSESRVQRIQHRLSDDEVQRLKTAFLALDENEDGFIDAGEMDRALRGVLSECLQNKEEIDEFVSLIMVTADKDNDGKISLTEFIASFASGNQAMDVPLMVAEERINAAIAELNDILLEEDIRKLASVFAVLDENKDGYLDKSELGDIMTTLVKQRYPEWDAEYVDKVVITVIAGADTNNDGRLSLEEFIRSFYEGHGVLPEDFVVDVADAIDEAVAQEEAQAQAAGDVPPPMAPPVPIGVAAPVAQPQTAAPQQTVVQAQPVVPYKEETPKKQIASPNKSMPPAPAPPPDLPSPTRTATASNPAYFPNDVTGVAVTHDQLWELFNQFDKDRTGYLDRSEFKKVYRTFEDYGLPPTDKQIDNIFTKYSNNDERLTFDEFAIIMLQRSKM
jgi:Ca2+-binding EF-hand superfamily protein